VNVTNDLNKFSCAVVTNVDFVISKLFTVKRDRLSFTADMTHVDYCAACPIS